MGAHGMNPIYNMWITDSARRRLHSTGTRVTHEEAMELLPGEHDRNKLYALVPNGPHMVDSDGDHWRRVA
jgi:hypothetical protein